MKFRTTMLAVPICFTSFTAALAQPIQGVYVGAGAGVRVPFSVKNTPSAPGFGGRFELEQKSGIETRLSIGYGLGNGWRFELEGNLGQSDIKNVSGARFPASAKGTVRDRGAMVNALFDMDIGSPWVYPFMGLGVGYQSTRLDGFTLTRLNGPFRYSANGDAGGFAAQAIAGLALPVPNVPGLSVMAEYRLIDVLGGQTFNGASSFGPGNTKFHNQFSQNATLGLRYAFNTPAPAEASPPAAAPAVATQYLVPFDLNQSALNTQGTAIVKTAAAASVKVPAIRLMVSGNADTSGGADYNQALSERRAKAVTAALVRDGVPREAISVEAFGDTRPLVSTGPSVVEARNRRVEIVTR